MFPFLSGFGVMEPFPSAPTITSVVPTVGSEDTSLTVHFTQHDAFVRWKQVEKKLAAAPSWTTVETAWTGNSPYVATGLTDNANWFFRINTYNLTPKSPWSNTGSGWTDYAPVEQAPSWASGYPKDDPADAVSILIRCLAAVPEAVTYKVYWKKDAVLTGDPPTNADGNFNWPDDDPTVEHDHTESGWGNGDVIYYAVTGNNPDSEGPALFGNATVLMAAPTAPSLVAASIVGTDIRITWQDNSSNEDNFRIEYQESLCGGSFGSWTWIGVDPSANDELYDWPNASEGYKYIFRVRAENAGGDSVYDEMTEGEAVTYSFVPGAPTWTSTYPKKDPADPDDDIDLSWANSGTGTIDDTKIYRSLSGGFTPGAGTLIDTVDAAVTTYNDDELGGPLDTPVISSVSALGNDELRISWSPGVGDADEYDLHRGATSGFTPDSGNKVTTTTFLTIDDDDGGVGLNANTEYFYKVIARKTPGDTFYYKLIHVNDCGQTGTTSAQGSATLDAAVSVASTADSATTWPDSPLSFNALHDDVGCDETPDEYWVDLTWNNGGNTGSTTWIRWSDVSASGPWTNLNTAYTAGLEFYDHLTATGDVRNYYEIKFNGGGDGSYSADSVNVVCPE